MEPLRHERVRDNYGSGDVTTFRCMPTLDVRNVPPKDRHSRIKSTFEDMDPDDVLELVNDHDPKPLFYEMQAEQDAFDADGYEVEQRGPEEFVATFPKR